MENKSRTKRWKAEEKRDRVEATVEEEAVMEEEGEEDIVEEAEVEAEAMAVEEGEAVMEGVADTAAARVAEEASNAIVARYLWRRAKKSMLQLIRLAGEATESPVSTTL